MTRPVTALQVRKVFGQCKVNEISVDDRKILFV